MVSLRSSKQTAGYAARSSTDGGREAAAGDYRLKLTLTADSIPGSWQWSSTLQGQPQFSGEYDKEFSKEENEDLNATLSFVGSKRALNRIRQRCADPVFSSAVATLACLLTSPPRRRFRSDCYRARQSATKSVPRLLSGQKIPAPHQVIPFLLGHFPGVARQSDLSSVYNVLDGLRIDSPGSYRSRTAFKRPLHPNLRPAMPRSCF